MTPTLYAAMTATAVVITLIGVVAHHALADRRQRNEYRNQYRPVTTPVAATPPAPPAWQLEQAALRREVYLAHRRITELTYSLNAARQISRARELNFVTGQHPAVRALPAAADDEPVTAQLSVVRTRPPARRPAGGERRPILDQTA